MPGSAFLGGRCLGRNLGHFWLFLGRFFDRFLGLVLGRYRSILGPKKNPEMSTKGHYGARGVKNCLAVKATDSRAGGTPFELSRGFFEVWWPFFRGRAVFSGPVFGCIRVGCIPRVGPFLGKIARATGDFGQRPVAKIASNFLPCFR